jgi:hypothetical protein
MRDPRREIRGLRREWWNNAEQHEEGVKSHAPGVVVLCRSLPFSAVLCRSLPFSAVLCRSLPFSAVLCRSLPFSAVFYP